MKLDAVLLARIYCGAAAALLVSFGLSAWAEAGDATIAGVMTFGVGLFVAFGIVAKPTRLLAVVVVCGCFAVFAFVAEFVKLAWHDEPPNTAALSRWIVEIMATLLSWKVSRPLFAAVTRLP